MKTSVTLVLVLGFACVLIGEPALKEASFYRKMAEKSAGCFLCPKNCVIPAGKYGFCRARKNIDGALYAMGYGRPCSVAIDPIEKKPFFHYLPATKSFSIASAGCNLRCKFCQNWQISQCTPEQTENRSLSPEQVVQYAARYGCASIAYTYSEPMNFYEYMLDTAKLARDKGIKNVVHTAGYINPEPLEQLCPYLDAANVDLKGFNPDYYRDMCEGDLATVLDALVILKKHGVWIEITNLVVPGYNDSPDEIKRMCVWIKKNLGENTPLHFSRFHPVYRMTHLSWTPVATVEKAVEVARQAGLKYVYIGNIPQHERESTFCPKCGKMIIKRVGFVVTENNLAAGKCRYCGEKIAGVWK